MNDTVDYARYDRIRPIRWTGSALELLDQRKLPFVVEYLSCTTSDEVAAAIHDLAVRGAPAIGVAAAYGVVIGVQGVRQASRDDFDHTLQAVVRELASSRPTAVNLFWALDRMQRVAASHPRLEAAAMHDRLLQDNPLLERSIRNRFPYLDPLNHVQVELLKTHRAETGDDDVLRGIQLTINGISAGLRNSG